MSSQFNNEDFVKIFEDFDFGFTAMDESEVSSDWRIEELVKLTSRLLTQLKGNPDKDYIYWPNRIDKIEELERHIKKIVD